MILQRFFILVCLLGSPLSLAFENEFLKFDLPKSWMCEHKPPNWVCSPQSSKDQTEAIVVVSAKQAGPEDNLGNYLKHLGQPKMLAIKEAKAAPQPSKVIHAKQRLLGPQKWVEGLHLGSEVRNFYTLYLATKSQNLSILVSLSADKAKARKYNNVFARVVKSIRVKRLKMESRRVVGQQGVAAPGEYSNVQAPIPMTSSGLVERVLGSKLLTSLVFAFAIMIIAIVFFAFKS